MKPESNFLPELPPREAVSRDATSILRAQLESSERPSTFDTEIINLLKEVSGSESKSAIVNELARRGLIAGTFIASKAIGIVAGLGAGEMGKNYATHRAGEYLSRFLLTPQAVKGAASHVAGGIKDTVGKAASVVTDALPTSVTSGIQSAWSSVVKHVQDFGHSVTTTLPEMNGVIDTASHKAHALGELGDQGLTGSVHAVNEYVVQPTIDVTAKGTGYAAYLPSATIGYLAGSALFGGAVGVYQEIKKEHSFAVVKELIDTMESSVDASREKRDACLELIATFTKISNKVKEVDKHGYSFTRDQWLAFASAVREAKVYLLRDKTKPAEIIADPAVKKGMEVQNEVVRGIIDNQKGLTDADRELATAILGQFCTAISQDIDPIMREHAAHNHIASRIQRYSGVFVRKGFAATGLPLLWRAMKVALETGSFAARLAIPFIK